MAVYAVYDFYCLVMPVLRRQKLSADDEMIVMIMPIMRAYLNLDAEQIFSKK